MKLHLDINFQTHLVPQFRANLQDFKEFIINSADKTIHLFTNSDLSDELEDISQVNLKFQKGFVFDRGFALDNQILLTDFELFNKKAVIGIEKKKQFKQKDYVPINLDSIKVNDYLVHLKHGIGRFLGLKTLEINGQKKEYLRIEYREGDLLNVPVEQMNLLTSYRSGGVAPKLSRLGGIDWEKTKKSAKASIEKIAEDLVQLYAKRALIKGFSFPEDTVWQQELEDSFSYTETPDQLRAINEIKADMESENVMDRLLCGDVGFGKTEVVIRAAFKAIMAGKQASVLAPTTILATQHFRSFKERFGNFPVKVELLTRAKTESQKKELLNRLHLGEVDLIIGTHALLSKNVKFKDLGLVIIDEEQKFGVKHKEKLKKMKEEVSVLTVSATPIPRTLHMALSGIREVSLISTPPTGRVPIKTQVAKYDLKIIRAAILREIERGGQVFYLHNRVETIENKAIELMNLVPEASFKVAHGQMPEEEASQVMESFIEGEFDVLIATSIIENGLDIPNANTMIVESADKMGLGQLYQLRGRVGRSNDPSKPGFALLLYNSQEKLTQQAKERLEAISKYGNLGSGYQIALRDMEIRGVGNMLGSAQHGKMSAIGFELYCEMLNEEIKNLKNKIHSSESETQKSSISMTIDEKPVIDFKVDAYIPIDWMEDDQMRLSEYQRLSNINSLNQLSNLKDEWIDRFGLPPKEVNNLFQIVKLRLLATESLFVGLIRPLGDFIQLQTKHSFYKVEASLRNQIRNKKLDRLAIIKDEKGDLKIIVKIRDLNITDQLNLLEEVFQLQF